jgi:hypothetical protein
LQELRFTVTASDPDVPPQTLSYSATGLPAGASLDSTTGAFRWIPDLGTAGEYKVTFKVSDSYHPPMSDSETVTIRVVKIKPGCVKSRTYWRYHPDEWTVASMTLGDETYSKIELIDLLNSPPRGDASMLLLYQLVPSKLNIASGSDPAAIRGTIADANRWLACFEGKLPYRVSLSHALPAIGWVNRLCEYNNGVLDGGPPRCFWFERAPKILGIVDQDEVLINTVTAEWEVVYIMATGADHEPGTDDDILLGSAVVNPEVNTVTVPLDLNILPGDCIYAIDSAGDMSPVDCLEK